MTALELRTKRAGVLKAAKTVNEKARTEDRDLTDDEKTDIDAKLAEAEQLEAGIAQIEADMARQNRLKTGMADLDKPLGRRTAPDSVEDEVAKVIVGKNRLEDDPTGGFRSPNEQFRAIKAAGIPGAVSRVDERLLILNAAYGQSEESGEEGAFLLAPEFSNRIVERGMEIVPILKQCDRLTLGSNSITVTGLVDHDRSGTTYRYGGIVVYWVAEAGQLTRSNLKFRLIKLELNKLGALAYATDEMLEDTNINLGNRMLDKMALAIADEMIEAIMFGNGAGKPLGAFHGDACVSVSRGTATTIKFEDIINVEKALWPGSERNANYYFNKPECWGQLRTMKLSGGTGNVPATIMDTRDRSIDGRPYFPTEHCSALGTAGDLVLGDFTQYLLATKGNVKTAMSVHIRFDYMETCFRAAYRVDGKPAWDRTLTPRKGSQLVSPFVKLK